MQSAFRRLSLLIVMIGGAYAPAATEQVSYAQLLVDHVLFRGPGVRDARIYAATPDTTAVTVIGAGHGPVGERTTNAVPLEVIRTGKPVVGPADGPGAREVVLPLRDATSATIGALSLIFQVEDSEPAERTLERALEIRNRLQEITPKAGTLLDPYTKGWEATDTLAQKINQRLLERHPDVNVIAIHLTAPGEKTNKVWGINRPNFIGRDSDEIDTDTEKTGRIVMQVIPATHRMEVHMPLYSRDGRLWGTICTVYFWHEVREAGDLYGRSLGIMDEVRNLMPATRAELFRP